MAPDGPEVPEYPERLGARLAVQPQPVSGARPGARATVWIVALASAGWLFLAWIAVDMSHPVARSMMPVSARWSVAQTLAVWSMWSIMMAAMMLPSALPMVRAFVGLSARSGDARRGRAFVAAYLMVWAGFSAVATAAQWAFQAGGWLTPMIISASPWLTAGLLLIAGIYQFSPLKRVCLARCRSPLGFLLGEWRAGTGGAFVMGLRHGGFCVGCCWALMALLFVGGVMNLAWIAALSVAVLLEKLLPRGRQVAALMGWALILAGCARLLVAAGIYR